jgi:hypothetical protein
VLIKPQRIQGTMIFSSLSARLPLTLFLMQGGDCTAAAQEQLDSGLKLHWPRAQPPLPSFLTPHFAIPVQTHPAGR